MHCSLQELEHEVRQHLAGVCHGSLGLHPALSGHSPGYFHTQKNDQLTNFPVHSQEYKMWRNLAYGSQQAADAAPAVVPTKAATKELVVSQGPSLSASVASRVFLTE